LGDATRRNGARQVRRDLHEPTDARKKIVAKKDGGRVKVDLNSIDDYLEALPDVGGDD
jgi:hypothetical protein